MRSGALVACTEGGIVPASLLEAEWAIGSAENIGGVVIVLPISLPKADRTNFERAALFEREATAARAGETPARLRSSSHRTLIELATVLLEPMSPRFDYLW